MEENTQGFKEKYMLLWRARLEWGFNGAANNTYIIASLFLIDSSLPFNFFLHASLLYDF